MNKVKKISLFGFLFVSVLGVLLHYTYEWSSENEIVGSFSAVNESTWEHMKLLFFPVFLFTLFEAYYFKGQDKCVFYANAIGGMAGLLSIPVIFYTYTGILGTHIMPVDIALFFVSVFITFLISNKILNSSKTCTASDNLKGMIIFAIIMVLFFVWTYNPPALPMFMYE